MSYTAGSLNDIAAQFEEQSRILRLRSVGTKTQREGRELLAESRTWLAAAAMLRETKLKDQAA